MSFPGDRLVFDVVWGPAPFDPLDAGLGGSGGRIGVADLETSVEGLLRVPFVGPLFADSFEILFASIGDRSFLSASLVGFDGTAALPLDGEPYGARLVYGEPLPPATVPETGSSLLLLLGGLGVMQCLQLGMRSRHLLFRASSR